MIVMDNDEYNINDVIDGTTLTVPFVQTSNFTRIDVTSVMYGMVQFQISYNIGLRLPSAAGRSFSAI